MSCLGLEPLMGLEPIALRLEVSRAIQLRYKGKINSLMSCLGLMHTTGFEPVRSCEQRNLSPSP